MAIMFGDGKLQEDDIEITRTVSKSYVKELASKTGYAIDLGNATLTLATEDVKFYDENGKNEGITYETAAFVTFTTTDVEGGQIDISANSFPGTYYVVGDTYARSEITGKDEMFQFVIPKAKVQSENTLTLEAEGDPSVDLLNALVKAA